MNQMVPKTLGTPVLAATTAIASATALFTVPAGQNWGDVWLRVFNINAAVQTVIVATSIDSGTTRPFHDQTELLQNEGEWVWIGQLGPGEVVYVQTTTSSALWCRLSGIEGS